MTQSQQASKGFTLIELMITVAVAAIIAMIGVPSFKSLIDQNYVTSASNDLLYHLMLARSEAVKLNTSTIICPLNPQEINCSTSIDWSTGWGVFLNNTSSSQEDNVVRVRHLESEIDIQASSSSLVLFGPLGNASFMEFQLSRDNAVRYVCIEVSGRAYVSHQQCAQFSSGGTT